MYEGYDYPEDETLDQIKNWSWEDGFAKLMEFVHKVWWMPEWGWSEEDSTGLLDDPVRLYSISTGGWSGNESLIDAMQSNYIFWSLCWKSHTRGGHYEFEVRKAKVEFVEEQ